MSVNPINRGSVQSSEWCRIHKPGQVGSEAGKPTCHASGAKARTSISPERLRDVLDRVQSGFYDGPEILRHVAERAAGELDAIE